MSHDPIGDPSGQIRRTAEMGTGRLVEELYLYATDKQLSDVERQDIVEDALTFEECSYTDEELHAMDDTHLIAAHYWIMSEYASGQV